ncbi:MAG: restriction endonuclease [Clostridia bacterium]|nr:restriction endonuclease [Clostridia bacterium]
MDESTFGILTFLVIVLVCVLIGYVCSNADKKKKIAKLEQKLQELEQQNSTLAIEQKKVLKDYIDAKLSGVISYPLEKDVQELYAKHMDVQKPLLYASSLMSDYLLTEITRAENDLRYSRYVQERDRAPKIRQIKEKAALLVRQAVLDKYDFEHYFVRSFTATHSNLDGIPFFASVYADLCTADFSMLIEWLSFFDTSAELKKAASITALKEKTRSRIEQLKWADYQLQYLISLYPALQDVIETDYHELDCSMDDVTDYDPARRYLSSAEWNALTRTERNQLALDRYVESRKKSNWQIGRDYELYVGYEYLRQGYTVDFYGSYMGLEDLGRDLICSKGEKTLIIQCKYWSKEKKIHEKHIMQLYGSLTQYKIENPGKNVSGVLVTNTVISDVAHKFADILHISCIESNEFHDFPRIKCNIGRDEKGQETKIYHLPMDQQYDNVKIDQPGECFAFTVAEAEQKGFRRAYKWRTTKE